MNTGVFKIPAIVRLYQIQTPLRRQPQIVGVADDLRTCLMMADYGLGISVTPLEALRGYPHLTRRVIAEKGLVSTLELVLRKDAYISASAKALFTVFKERDKNQEE